jgi:hypothetical protein
MHVIEQVSGICFPSDGSNHKLLKISNKISITAAKELKRVADEAKGKGKGTLTSRSHCGATSPPAAPTSSTRAEPTGEARGLAGVMAPQHHSKLFLCNI